jgi:hypothetical protein
MGGIEAHTLMVMGNPQATVSTSSPGSCGRFPNLFLPSFRLVRALSATRLALDPLLTKTASRAQTHRGDGTLERRVKPACGIES